MIAALMLTAFACNKNKTTADPETKPEGHQRCGTILATPTLDSFIYPTYYITTMVAFPEGSEILHFHANVSGNHDGSWYLPRYSKDSSICITVP